MYTKTSNDHSFILLLLEYIFSVGVNLETSHSWSLMFTDHDVCSLQLSNCSVSSQLTLSSHVPNSIVFIVCFCLLIEIVDLKLKMISLIRKTKK